MVCDHNRLLVRGDYIEVTDGCSLELEGGAGDLYDGCLVDYGIVYDTFENYEPFELLLQDKYSSTSQCNQCALDTNVRFPNRFWSILQLVFF